MTKMKCRQCEHFEECRSENIIIDATTSNDNWQNPFDHVYIFGLIDEAPSYCNYEKESLDCINRVIIEDTKMNRKEFYPTADAVEVVHGMWKDGRCTNCNVALREVFFEEPISYVDLKYCPFCGARMDGE